MSTANHLPRIPSRSAHRPVVRPWPPDQHPFKPTRYPWTSPKEKRMTIAAGFRVANGVLIGADTRIEEGNVKYEENKVFDCRDNQDDYSYAVMLAGAGDFEAISHCADLLRSHGFSKSSDSICGLKESLLKFIEGKRYRRLNARMTATRWFTGIVALRSIVGETDILYLSGENLYPVPEYKCIGAGSETALFVSKWLYRRDLSVNVFLPMAIQIFRAAKGHNVGCDDATRIVRLYNAGTGLDDPQRSVWGDTEYLWGVHDLLGSAIQGCFDLRVATEEFKAILRALDEKLIAIRVANERSKQLTSEVKQFLESTTRDPQFPPASPESP